MKNNDVIALNGVPQTRRAKYTSHARFIFWAFFFQTKM
jgi:hypothetical protein